MGFVLKAAAFKSEVNVLTDEDIDVEEDGDWEVFNVDDQV